MRAGITHASCMLPIHNLDFLREASKHRSRMNSPMRSPKPKSEKSRILIADDDRWLLESMAEWMSGLGYQIQTASNIGHAQRLLAASPFDLLLCDVRFEDGDGLAMLRQVRSKYPSLPVVMMSGYAGPDAACEAIAAGAFDFLTKPIIDQELQAAIERALHQQQIAAENSMLKQQLDRRFGLENIVSHDLRMLKVFDTLESVADARATILITGENGTGKSMVARAVHKKSSRRNGPFVEVACGALPDTLLESELFGHVAGAFTGANANKIGKFQQAHQGTLFLDEIGTATPALQVKLLRALQELQFEPLGGNETVSVDTRTILATNEHLEQAVAEGRFRQDLYYRINVIRIELPPLRERLDDIPLLAQHFLSRACEEYQRSIEGFSLSAIHAMQQYRWPGNIRELENTIQRAVLLCKGRLIESDLLPIAINPFPPSPTSPNTSSSLAPPTPLAMANDGRVKTLSEALEEPERQIILEVLRANQWNRNTTADLLGINRTTLYKKMKKLGIEENVPDTIATAVLNRGH
jgi:DNA-binding NtrC family response regulator